MKIKIIGKITSWSKQKISQSNESIFHKHELCLLTIFNFWGHKQIISSLLSSFSKKSYHCTYFSDADLCDQVLQSLEMCSFWVLEMLLLNLPWKFSYQFEDGEVNAFKNVSEGKSSLGFCSRRDIPVTNHVMLLMGPESGTVEECVILWTNRHNVEHLLL